MYMTRKFDLSIGNTGAKRVLLPLDKHATDATGVWYAYRLDYPVAGGPLDAPDYIQAGATRGKNPCCPAASIFVSREAFV